LPVSIECAPTNAARFRILPISERVSGTGMATERTSRIKVELTHLFKQQIEYFRKCNVGELSPAERREYEKRRERIQQLFAELTGLRKAA
jgi:hypothetical protein